MGRVDGKVAFITGAARGQGRSHAVRLAQEGADIIAIDICDQIDSVDYAMATPDDMAETVRLVEGLGRRIVASHADVRDFGVLEQAVAEGVAELGRLDIVSANAGIVSSSMSTEMPEQMWQDVIDVNLTGVWHTCNATAPHLIAGANGGSIAITCSTASVKALGGGIHYAAAKHGVVGIVKAFANELGPHRVRVNGIAPTILNSPMVADNIPLQRRFRPDLENPTLDDALAVAESLHVLPVAWIEPVDISNALLFLASDEARYITGAILPVDAGNLVK
jgi:SDR family mycofactocin-dependent oxidoreductase